jgi:hypothetical protein
MPAAAIYTRVSTDEQARHGVSLEAQREACLAYCARSGLVVAAVIVDLEARQLRNLEAMQAGALTPDLLAQANRPLVEEHARLSEELAALEAGARTPGQWVRLGAGAGERPGDGRKGLRMALRGRAGYAILRRCPPYRLRHNACA